MSEQSFIEVPSIKFHRTLSGGSRTKSVRLPQTDRQTGRQTQQNQQALFTTMQMHLQTLHSTNNQSKFGHVQPKKKYDK